MNNQLITEIYQQLCIDSDENLLANALSEKYADEDFDRAFKVAYNRFLKQTAPGYPAKFRQALASYSLIAARSFHVCDYKTAKSALDSKVKLLLQLEEKDNFSKAVSSPKGRPSTYSDKKAQEICTLMKYNGWSLNQAANATNTPPSSVYRWRDEIPAFREAISRARNSIPEHLRENAIDLLQELKTNHQKATTPDEKARCLDAYRRFLEFMLSKLCPEYRDKQTLEMTGANGAPLNSSSAEEMQRFAAMVADAEKRIADQAREKGQTIKE